LILGISIEKKLASVNCGASSAAMRRRSEKVIWVKGSTLDCKINGRVKVAKSTKAAAGKNDNHMR